MAIHKWYFGNCLGHISLREAISLFSDTERDEMQVRHLQDKVGGKKKEMGKKKRKKADSISGCIFKMNK